MKQERGFSLIEVMISIVIIGVIGVISAAIFTQTLRTSEEVNDISNLKQNGEQALNLIAEGIRSAEAVVCYGSLNPAIPQPSPSQGASPTPRYDVIVIRTGEGKYTKFRFVDPTTSQDSVTANGYIARQDNLNAVGVGDLSNLCAADNVQTSPVTRLTNNDLTTGVSINVGSFTKISSNLGKDTLIIRFWVNPTKTLGSYIGSEVAAMQTTVQVR